MNIQNKARLSESKLWKYQKTFYEREGIDAWANKIPHFSTCNVFMAHAYANILFRFMQEEKKLDKSKEPFYILELGSGTGMFGFYLLKELCALQEKLGLGHLTFVYLMTDFAEKNIAFWEQHSCFSEFTTNGSLGFGRYEIGVDDSIEITIPNQKGTLKIDKENPIVRPLIVLANYLFDSLPCDIFKIQNGQLQEGLTRREIKPNTNEMINIAEYMDDAGFDFDYVNTDSEYYDLPECNKVLTNYVGEYEEAHFLFPIGAIDCLNKLKSISNEKLFVIVTDKAFSDAKDLINQKPNIVLHNSAFSLTVNFHAIGEYAKLHEGDVFHQNFLGSINTSVFTFGFNLSEYTETANALNYYIDNVGPSNLFNLYTSLERLSYSLSPEELISVLNLLCWDPTVVSTCIEQFIAGAGQLPNHVLNALKVGLYRSAAYYFNISGTDILFFNVGRFFQTIGEYDVALEFYDKSVKVEESVDNVCYNMALCNYMLGYFDVALSLFNEAQNLGYDESVLLKGWIVQAEEMLETEMISLQ